MWRSNNLQVRAIEFFHKLDEIGNNANGIKGFIDMLYWF